MVVDGGNMEKKNFSFYLCLNMVKNWTIIAAVFPGGTKIGNPTMTTTSTVTARRKGDPQHVLREK